MAKLSFIILAISVYLAVIQSSPVAPPDAVSFADPVGNPDPFPDPVADSDPFASPYAFPDPVPQVRKKLISG